jgi:hypothetical protein
MEEQKIEVFEKSVLREIFGSRARRSDRIEKNAP